VLQSVTISLLAGFAGFPPPRQPGLLLALIHRSAWKSNSRNFALPEFYEVQVLFVLWGTYLFVGQEYAAFVAWHRSLHATHIGVGC
jgi:hypothetical protein